MAKAKKKRAEKYDPKLKIEGDFDDVIGVSVGQIPPKIEAPKEPAPKKAAPKKKGK